MLLISLGPDDTLTFLFFTVLQDPWGQRSRMLLPFENPPHTGHQWLTDRKGIERIEKCHIIISCLIVWGREDLNHVWVASMGQLKSYTLSWERVHSLESWRRPPSCNEAQQRNPNRIGYFPNAHCCSNWDVPSFAARAGFPYDIHCLMRLFPFSLIQLELPNSHFMW